MNPIDMFGVEACTGMILVYAAIGAALWLQELNQKNAKKYLEKSEWIFLAVAGSIRGAFIWAVAAIAGLCLAAGLCSLIDHWLVQDVCADHPISCISIMRVL